MGTIFTLGAKLVADVNQYISDMNNASKSTGGAQTSIKSLAAQALGAVGGVAAIGTAVKAAADYMIAAEKAANDLNIAEAKQAAILKATGGVSGQTTASLKELTDQLAKLSGVDDDLIRSGESVLLTFRNVGSKEFPRAMQAAVDLQTTFGSLESSSMQLGKALNDPVAGISALAKAGVTFSDVQKEQIKNFVDTNQIAKAQNIILAEVEKEVGGTAESMNKASDGADRLKLAQDDLSKAIGQKNIPVTREYNQWLTELFNWLTKNTEAQTKHEDAVYAVGNAYGYTNDQIRYALQNGSLWLLQLQDEIAREEALQQAIWFKNQEAQGNIITTQKATAADAEARQEFLDGKDLEIAEWKELARAKAEYYHVTPEGGEPAAPGKGVNPLPAGAAGSKQYGEEATNLTKAQMDLDAAQKKLNQDKLFYPANKKLIDADTKALQAQNKATTESGLQFGLTSEVIQKGTIARIAGDKTMTLVQKQQLLQQGIDQGEWSADTIKTVITTGDAVKDFASSWKDILTDRSMTVYIRYSDAGGGGGGKTLKRAAWREYVGQGQYIDHPDEYNAKGTNNFKGGLTVVGEEGPEIAELPAGTVIHSNPESRRLLSAFPHAMNGMPGEGGSGGGSDLIDSVSRPFVSTDEPALRVRSEKDQATRDRQHADEETKQVQAKTSATIERLEKTIGELSDSIRKTQEIKIDYGKLTRAIRDGNAQSGVR